MKHGKIAGFSRKAMIRLFAEALHDSDEDLDLEIALKLSEYLINDCGYDVQIAGWFANRYQIDRMMRD